MREGQIFSGMNAEPIPYAHYVGAPTNQPLSIESVKAQFPYMKDANINVIHTPDPNEFRQLEYWAPGSKGFTWQHGDVTRPSELPLNQTGIQIFNPKVKPMDVFADYVSHEAVQTDPKLKRLYEQFANMVPDKTLQDRYRFHQKSYGEDRTYEDWKQETGLPEFMRGYTFGQWKNAKEMYTPEQLKQLDLIKQHIGLP